MIVIPTDQDNGVIHIRTFRAQENTAVIALKSGVYADGSRNGPMVINGLLYGLSGWNTILASHEGIRVDLLVMCVGWVTGIIPGCVGEIGFINGPRVGLA